jgi:hypothetical protein
MLVRDTMFFFILGSGIGFSRILISDRFFLDLDLGYLLKPKII